ncbi:uncharacterized protein [Aegilops tauschii subsp. strangulata]|uniref:uncharacterized protein isoform X1 n=1 Tax=Aegilops tauschii subsp. strangulata TaxID=200361 RepID=UPI003CC84720
METISISRMPAPSLRLELSVSKEDKRLDFLPFYERGSKILCVDAEGRTVLYDTDAGLLHSMPCLGSPKGPNPVSFSILDREPRDPGRADALYVMGRCCNYFDLEALMYCDPSSGRKGWRWHQLPPPPPPQVPRAHPRRRRPHPRRLRQDERRWHPLLQHLHQQVVQGRTLDAAVRRPRRAC